MRNVKRNHLQTGLELFETVYVVRETVSNGFKLLTSLQLLDRVLSNFSNPTPG
jgi:hypothetical protein